MSHLLARIYTSNKVITMAWLVLVVATLIAWSLGASVSENVGSMGAVAGVIITAFIKTWVIGMYFMELKGAVGWLKHGYSAWNLVLCGVILFILFFSPFSK